MGTAANITGTAADHHDAAPGGDADGHVLCQIACEAQAQSRDFVKALEIPAPVAHRVVAAAAVDPGARAADRPC